MKEKTRLLFGCRRATRATRKLAFVVRRGETVAGQRRVNLTRLNPNGFEDDCRRAGDGHAIRRTFLLRRTSKAAEIYDLYCFLRPAAAYPVHERRLRVRRPRESENAVGAFYALKTIMRARK